jgi:hypothetical protein
MTRPRRVLRCRAPRQARPAPLPAGLAPWAPPARWRRGRAAGPTGGRGAQTSLPHRQGRPRPAREQACRELHAGASLQRVRCAHRRRGRQLLRGPAARHERCMPWQPRRGGPQPAAPPCPPPLPWPPPPCTPRPPSHGNECTAGCGRQRTPAARAAAAQAWAGQRALRARQPKGCPLAAAAGSHSSTWRPHSMHSRCQACHALRAWHWWCPLPRMRRASSADARQPSPPKDHSPAGTPGSRGGCRCGRTSPTFPHETRGSARCAARARPRGRQRRPQSDLRRWPVRRLRLRPS